MQIDDEDLGAFDRIVSVEMMEHMKNYQLLLEKVSRFLKADGLLFVHIFTHAHASYHFETSGSDNWMGRHFFTGGNAAPTLPLPHSIFIQSFITIVSRLHASRHHAQPRAAQELSAAPIARSVMDCEWETLCADLQCVAEEDGRQYGGHSPAV
jgi:cyclopropane fatty-acyl-phospholipid synthase-like methyltransferase